MRDGKQQQDSAIGCVQIIGNHNTVNHHTHHHNHAHFHEAPAFALQAPPAPPARKARATRPVYDITPAQRDCLALLRALPKVRRNEFMDWMRCEFGTALVMDLAPPQLHRLRQQVLRGVR